jgi:hypothetical protein
MELGQGNRHREGEEVFNEDVERKIEGSTIKRKASPEEPAYLIVQEDGGRVLKSHSELEKPD